MADSSKTTKTGDPTVCPHCGMKMVRWQASDMNPWGDAVHYVCFNDQCPYYKRGWQWMNDHYSVHGSYRHRYNPDTGASGPLPVWSDDSLRSGILDDDDAETPGPEEQSE